MPIDSRCLLLIDYDEKQDWWFIDDNWSWMMNDDKGHKWWFIVIDNDKPWMITDWQTDWLTDLLIDYKIIITKSVIIPAVSGLYRPTGLLFHVWRPFYDEYTSLPKGHHKIKVLDLSIPKYRSYHDLCPPFYFRKSTQKYITFGFRMIFDSLAHSP